MKVATLNTVNDWNPPTSTLLAFQPSTTMPHSFPLLQITLYYLHSFHLLQAFSKVCDSMSVFELLWRLRIVFRTTKPTNVESLPTSSMYEA